MYAREYAKTRGYPYPMILRLCREGKIPSIKQQKYLIDPDEADAAIEIIKRTPKAVAKAEVEEIKGVHKPNEDYLERLKASGRERKVRATVLQNHQRERGEKNGKRHST